MMNLTGWYRRQRFTPNAPRTMIPPSYCTTLRLRSKVIPCDTGRNCNLSFRYLYRHPLSPGRGPNILLLFSLILSNSVHIPVSITFLFVSSYSSHDVHWTMINPKYKKKVNWIIITPLIKVTSISQQRCTGAFAALMNKVTICCPNKNRHSN
jgi:hypothetical protein